MNRSVKKTLKLKLNRDVLRVLNPQRLAQAAGGDGGLTLATKGQFTFRIQCAPTIQQSCIANLCCSDNGQCCSQGELCEE